jgi:hypothetical protein
MKAVAVILGLLAGLLLSLPSCPVWAQTGYPTQVAKLASLRSGNPQHVVNALETIKHDDLARTLYRNLYHVAGSEPSSLLEASSVAKALGFVLLIGLDDNLTPLSSTEFEEKQIQLTSLLLQVTPVVGGTVEQYQWRAVELMQFCTAYDFARAVNGEDNEVVEALLAAFAASATAQLENPFVIKNNLSLKLAAAAGYAGLMLRGCAGSGAKDPEYWLATAMEHIERTLWEYQSRPEGIYGYSEGPWYFRYAMMNLLPFFLAIDLHTDGGTLHAGDRRYESPIRDPRYHSLFEWIAALRMPSGMLPPFEDTYMNSFFPELGIVGGVLPAFRHLAWPNYTDALHTADPARISSELARSFDGRVEYLLAQPTTAQNGETRPLVRHMPDAGYSVSRSGWEADAVYFAMIGKHGIARTHRSPVGSGHKHANEGAVLLHAGGELLLMEPGYHSSAERAALVYSDHHNILLVDGQGPDSTSYGSSLFGVDAWIGDTLSRGTFGAAAVRTRYEDTDIERRSAFLQGRYVILRDHAAAAHSRSITHQLHGNGIADDGSYTLDQAAGHARWHAGAMTLHALVSTTNGTPVFTTARRSHAPASGRFARHDALYSSMTGRDVVFHTVLYPAKSGETITTDIRTPDEGTSRIHIRTGSDQLVSLVRSSTGSVSVDAGPFGTLTTDALAFHCILDPAGRPASWMCDEGSIIRRDDAVLLSSSLPVRAVCSSTPDGLQLTVRTAQTTVIRLRVSETMTRISGTGLRDWSMEEGMLRIVVDGDADLEISCRGTATSVVSAATAGRPQLHAPYPQPLRRGSAALVHTPYTVASAAPVTFTLYDALGRALRRKQLTGRNAGTHVVSIPVDGLAPGHYILRAQDRFGSSARPIIIH